MSTRDLIGYGANLPVVKWPNGARIAISVVVNYEEGSEYSILDGDPRGEAGGESPSPVGPGERDLANESFYEYGSRVGVWRIMNILDKHQVTGTFFACALALERNPEVGPEIVRRGHEVMGHGNRWEEYYKMDKNSEREAIRQAVDKGVPVYAECGGLMYLGKSLSDLEGVTHPMIGVIPAESAMSQSRLTLGYREVESCSDSPVLQKGQRVRGHEFHWSTLAQQPEADESVYKVVDQDNRPDGFRKGNVWASYVHIHLGSRPGLAPRFVETCAAATT